jgi:hypothetical protein
MDVHPPHAPMHSWRDFWIHLGTISIGLLIAISLEQSVEWLHHRHQRHQLEEDLYAEAENNRQVILRDLKIEGNEEWFRAAVVKAASVAPATERGSFSLPMSPCRVPGSMDAGNIHYFHPSEAVWTAAKDSGMVALLPAEQDRIYGRLSHNLDLLSLTRNHMAETCDMISSMELRFAVKAADGASETWTMSGKQADEFSATAAAADTATRAVVFRLRFTLGYEEAILHHIQRADELLPFVMQQM